MEPTPFVFIILVPRYQTIKEVRINKLEVPNFRLRRNVRMAERRPNVAQQ